MRFSGIAQANKQFSNIFEVYVSGSYGCGLASETSDLDLVLQETKHPQHELDSANLVHVKLMDFDGRLSLRDPEVEIERVSDMNFQQHGDALLRKGPWSEGDSYESIVEFWEWFSMRPLGISQTPATLVPDLASTVADSCIKYSRAALGITADDLSMPDAAVLQRSAVGAALSGWLADRGEPNPKPKWRREQIRRLKARNVDCSLADQLLDASIGVNDWSLRERQERHEALCRQVNI